MRVVLVVMPFVGHVTPMRAIAAELVLRGHEVIVSTGTRFVESFSSVGATVVPWRHTPDFDDRDLGASFPSLGETRGIRRLIANLEHVFVGTAAAQYADLMDIWRTSPWDLLVSETTVLGAPLARESTGAPWTSIAITALSLAASGRPPPGLGLAPGLGPGPRQLRDAALRVLGRAVMAGPQRVWGRMRAEVGSTRADPRFDSASFSPELVLATGVPELDFAPLRRPPHVRFVGRLALPLGIAAGHATPHRLPEWWPELLAETRPIVHVTQGTLNVDPEELIHPSLAALAGEDLFVVVSTGRSEIDRLDFEVPGNARVAAFLPHELLLPRTSIMITNGGWGGTLVGLAHGVPLVVAGGELDKPETAARVAHSGAGVNLRTGRPSAARIAAAVGRIQGDARYRERAGFLARELDRHGGTSRAAGLLERHAASVG